MIGRGMLIGGAVGLALWGLLAVCVLRGAALVRFLWWLFDVYA